MTTKTRHPGHGYLQGVDRLRLHYRAWEADRPRGALLVVHGMFEHSRRYQELGAFMAESGLSTYALDLRGHGASEGRRGHVRRFELFLQDLDRFRREIEGLVPPGTPIFLLGHSMGGLIALRYLEEYVAPIAAAVLTSPWLGTAIPVPRWKVVLGGILNEAMPAFPFPFRIDAATLSHDDERVADYREDQDIHTTITPRLFAEISAAIHLALQRGDRIDVPVHMLLAGDDRLVDTARSLAFARSLNPERVTVEVVDGLFHELLQERERGRIMGVIRGFFLDRLD
jgi:alpha-beta hydrolase superfamily lysophospholipase